MKSIARVALLLVACAFAAQLQTIHTGFVVMAKPPSLPAVAHDVLPGEGWVLGTYKLRGQAVIFGDHLAIV